MSDVKKLTLNSSDFPEVLRNIPDPPRELYVIGDLAKLLKKPRLAVVGSRKVTSYGKAVTSQLTREVASKGVVIVSGLALGVDAVAHEAALEANGSMIVVLAHGLDTIQPATNHNLGKRILAKGGVLVSEYPEGLLPIPSNFIARNRIVSGLSDGVLITEAAAKSGTMHTANFALEQGKAVMAVPGNILSPMSEGTNNLIKAGATPVTNAKDILFALGLKETKVSQQEIFGENEAETLILQLLRQGVTETSILLSQSELDTAIFNQTITMLEINGKVRALGAGNWTLL